MKNTKDNKTIKIAGAGIAGITAAIVLARAGRNVEIYERASCTGTRFHGDFQGIENWTQKEDTLNFLKRIGIEINFNYKVFNDVMFWGPEDYNIKLKFKKPLFYLVRRGIERGDLDWGLQKQAKDIKA